MNVVAVLFVVWGCLSRSGLLRGSWASHAGLSAVRALELFSVLAFCGVADSAK